jgi:hypothetical protein
MVYLFSINYDFDRDHYFFHKDIIYVVVEDYVCDSREYYMWCYGVGFDGVSCFEYSIPDMICFDEHDLYKNGKKLFIDNMVMNKIIENLEK